MTLMASRPLHDVSREAVPGQHESGGVHLTQLQTVGVSQKAIWAWDARDMDGYLDPTFAADRGMDTVVVPQKPNWANQVVRLARLGIQPILAVDFGRRRSEVFETIRHSIDKQPFAFVGLLAPATMPESSEVAGEPVDTLRSDAHYATTAFREPQSSSMAWIQNPDAVVPEIFVEQVSLPPISTSQIIRPDTATVLQFARSEAA